MTRTHRPVNAVNVLELRDLSPATLGALMALYEHKTTMLATPVRA